MSTSWALSSSQIIRSALEHMGVVDAVTTPSAEDSAVCLRALNGLLKELPTYGYLWPEYREGVAVSWVSGATVTLPSDFYGFPLMKRSDGVILREFTPAEWADMDASSRAQSGVPEAFYRLGTTATLWPIPSTDPGLTLDYQSIVSDAVSAAQPDMPQVWLNGLAWGIAAECWMKYQVPMDRGQIIETKWGVKLQQLLSISAPDAPIEFTVAD